MTFTIATVNEFLFPIVLFFFYFCAANLILNQWKKETTSHSQTLHPKNFAIADSVTSQFDSPTELETESELTEIATIEPIINLSPNLPEVVGTRVGSIGEETVFIPNDETFGMGTTSELYSQAAAIIDSLNKRAARKLCAPLSIRQKTNGVEKSLPFMKAEIRSKFKDNPQQVIEAIGDRLPDLLSNYSLAS